MAAITMFPLKGHSGTVNCLAQQQSLLLSGSDDKTARLWDLRTSKTSLAVMLPGEVTSVSFAGSSSQAEVTPFGRDATIFASYDSSIWEYDLRQAQSPIMKHDQGSCIANEEVIKEEVNQLSYSKQRSLCAATDAGAVVVLDSVRSDEPSCTLQHADDTLVTCCRYRSGTQLASGDTHCRIYLWDTSRPHTALDVFTVAAPPENANQLCNPPMVHCMEWSSSGRILAAGCGDGTMALLRVDKRRKWVSFGRLHEQYQSSTPIASVSFLNWGSKKHNDRLLASAGTDGNVCVWDLLTLAGKNSVDPFQLLAPHLLENVRESDQPRLLFSIPHGAKANCLVSNEMSTIYVADTFNDITSYTIPLA